MNKQLLGASLLVLLSAANTVKAQDITSKLTIRHSQIMSYSEKANTLTLEGNASLTTDKLVVSKADKIVIEKSNNKITVYGACEFAFSGTLVRASTADNSNKKLEYTIGEDVMYVK